VAEKLKALERENRELRQANEILRKASVYFARANSVAGPSDDRLYRRSSPGARGRADTCKVLPIALPQPAAGSSEAVGFATLEWFGCFNDWGFLELIGNIPPAETANAATSCSNNQPT